MKKLRKYIESDKKREIDEINLKANAIYAQWRKIVDLRSKQGFTATFSDLKVHKGAEQNDILFNLEN